MGIVSSKSVRKGCALMHQKIYLTSLRTRVEILVVLRFSNQNWNCPLVYVYADTGSFWTPLASHVPYPGDLWFAEFIQDVLIGFDGALQEHE